MIYKLLLLTEPTLVKFADDLTLSVLVKGTQDQSPKEVENILSWAQNNLHDDYKPY